MGRIWKNLWEHKGAVVVIICLLVIQAVCDLSLPQYTSDIVDIGIQQNGIERVAMEEMRGETYESIEIFLSEEDMAFMEQSYEKTDKGNYKRKELSDENLDRLDEDMGAALVAISAVEESGKIDMDSLKAMMNAGTITKDQILSTKDQMMEQMGDISESIINQKAVLAVKEEYEKMGWDMGDYQMAYLISAGGKMIGVTMIMMVSAILVGLLAARTSASIGKELRSKIFKKVISFSNSEMNQFSTASLITRSTNDIQQIQMVSVMLLRMVLYAPILGIGGIIKVSSTKTGMGWVIGVAVGMILAVVAVLVAVAMPKFKKMQTLVDRMNLVSREILTGISVIRAFSREKHEEERFDKANKDLMSTQLFTSRVMTIMMPTMMLVMNGVTVLIVWVGSKGIDAGNLQVGDMMAFITYTMQIVMSFLMITMISIMLPRAGVAANRIDEVLKLEPSIKDKEDAKETKVSECKGVVGFEDVSFRYPGADEDALEHISFVAEPGKTTAIIGSTGCGKSTLLHLIPRFYDVTDGRITLDGTDIRELSQKSLRSTIGFVPQKGILFSGTIASNIQFSGEKVTEETMKEAAGIAQAMEFIEEKEDKFDSPISQGGTNVSGGQRQRLSIARAIAKQPKIFLFDDSFSALDYKTDVALRMALHEKLTDATVIIVAQRISTILHADRILVLEDGKIVGSGTHEELLENCETYLEIAKSQLSESELKEGVNHE